MKFSISYDGYEFIHMTHRKFGYTFTMFLKMWEFLRKVHEGAKL